MELWIPVTLAAAFCQNLRSALQKRLRDSLSVWGATAARFVYAAPLAVLAAAVALLHHGAAPPAPSPAFALYAAGGGLAQIAATGLLVHLFSFRNFTVATAFTKTEPIQTALFGVLLLGDRLSGAAAAAILVSLVGVVMISTPSGRARGAARLDRKAALGIAAGGLFGLSAVAYRGAALAVPLDETLPRAALALAPVTLFQSAVMLAWLRWRERGEITRLFAAWRPGVWVGLAGGLATLGWFVAFTLQSAAHVRALGQVDVVFTIAASVLLFGERVSAREVAGVLLVAGGIVALVLVSG